MSLIGQPIQQQQPLNQTDNQTNNPFIQQSLNKQSNPTADTLPSHNILAASPSDALDPNDSVDDPQWQSARAKCESMKRAALTQSHNVQFMIRSMTAAGCPIEDPEQFIECDLCEARVSGAMYQRPGTVNDDNQSEPEPEIGIVMCVNRLGRKTQDYFNTVVTHELIHSFDHCRAKIDFTNVYHHACTEIRAANLSGECSFKRELKRGSFAISNNQNRCVRRRAIFSVLGSAFVQTPEQAQEAVDSVFDRCIRDVQPHGSIPW